MAAKEAQEIENIIIEFFFFFCNMAFNNRIVPYKYNQMLNRKNNLSSNVKEQKQTTPSLETQLKSIRNKKLRWLRMVRTVL